MLTVKWIVQTNKGSVERIFPAEDVAIAYRNEPLTPADNDRSDFKVGRYEVGSAILIINPHDSSSDRALDVGLCYVMNEAGKTIGSYILSEGTYAYATGIPEPAPIADLAKAA